MEVIFSAVNTIKQEDRIHIELVFPAGPHLTAVREHSKFDFVWSVPPTHITPVCDILHLTNDPMCQISGFQVKNFAIIGLVLLPMKATYIHNVSPEM